MINLETLNEALEKCWLDTEFILDWNHEWYSDILESHRCILNYFELSFNISELIESEDESSTIVYRWDKNNNIIVFQEWISEFKSLQEYIDWLNRMQEEALHINK